MFESNLLTRSGHKFEHIAHCPDPSDDTNFYSVDTTKVFKLFLKVLAVKPPHRVCV